MYLIDKKKEIIQVYDLQINNDLAYNFRKKEMDKIENKIYSTCLKKFSSFYSDDPFEKFNFNKVTPDIKDVFFYNSEDDYNILKDSEEDEDVKEDLLEETYKGQNNKKEVIKVNDNGTIKYYILAMNIYTYLRDDDCYKMDGIIRITDKMYILKLIETGMINSVDSNQLKELLDLFTLTIREEFDKKTYEKMKNLNLLYIDSENAIELSNKDNIKIIRNKLKQK